MTRPGWWLRTLRIPRRPQSLPVLAHRDAHARVSGPARTVRGPVMSAMPGKIRVDGVAEVAGEKLFVLHLSRARTLTSSDHPFFAAYDEGRRGSRP